MSFKGGLLGAVMALSIAASQANAAPLDWSLVGVSFGDGGKATGSYTFDATTGVFSNISIATSGGNIAGATYGFVDGYSNASNAEFVNATGDLTGARVLLLPLVSAMTDLGGSILVSLIGLNLEGICSDPICTNGTLLRSVVSGSVTASPVPIPAALPLLASGLGALGFVGWRRKRKAAVTA
jgi:hypothetical protein